MHIFILIYTYIYIYMGVAQNEIRGVTQVLVQVSTYEGSILVPFFWAAIYIYIYIYNLYTPRGDSGFLPCLIVSTLG